jgi:tetratricopeptide (TPR) repeat protein
MLATTTANLPPPAEFVFGNVKCAQRATELWTQLQQTPGDTSSSLELGRILLQEGYITAAITVLETGLRTNEDVQLYLVLSSALQKRSHGELPKALRLLEEAVQRFPANGAAHLHLGQAHDAMGARAKAITELEKALELSRDPTVHLSAHLGLAANYTKAGERSQAEQHLQTARKIYPGIDKWLRDAEISRQLPAPIYAGQPGGDGVHPPLEKRIRRALADLEHSSGESKCM